MLALAAGPVLALALAAAVGGAAERSGSVRACQHQSSAGFPDAFERKSNLVAGPLVLYGARRWTDADTVRKFGGNKFPAILLAGHRVTVRVPRALRGKAALFYGDGGPDGERTLADGYAAIRFKACGRRRSASEAGGRPATFWSGFVLTNAPRCLRIRVRVDGEKAPRTRRIPLGRRCGQRVGK